MPPAYIGRNAVCQNSLVAEGCNIDGNLELSILFEGVTVEKGATVTGSILMPGSHIKAGATVQYSIIAQDAVIGANAVVGQPPEAVENKDEWGIAVVGHGVKVGDNAVVPAKAMLDEDFPAAK